MDSEINLHELWNSSNMYKSKYFSFNFGEGMMDNLDSIYSQKGNNFSYTDNTNI